MDWLVPFIKNTVVWEFCWAASYVSMPSGWLSLDRPHDWASSQCNLHYSFQPIPIFILLKTSVVCLEDLFSFFCHFQSKMPRNTTKVSGQSQSLKMQTLPCVFSRFNLIVCRMNSWNRRRTLLQCLSMEWWHKLQLHCLASSFPPN